MWTLIKRGQENDEFVNDSITMLGDISDQLPNILQTYINDGCVCRSVEESEYVYHIQKDDTTDLFLYCLDEVDDFNLDHTMQSSFHDLGDGRYIQLVRDTNNLVCTTYLYEAGMKGKKEAVLSSPPIFPSIDVDVADLLARSLEKIGAQAEPDPEPDTGLISRYYSLGNGYILESTMDRINDTHSLTIYNGSDPVDVVEVVRKDETDRYVNDYELIANYLSLILDIMRTEQENPDPSLDVWG